MYLNLVLQDLQFTSGRLLARRSSVFVLPFLPELPVLVQLLVVFQQLYFVRFFVCSTSLQAVMTQVATKYDFFEFYQKNTAKSKTPKTNLRTCGARHMTHLNENFWKDWYWSILNFTAGGEGGNDRLPVGIYGFGTQSFCSVLGFYHFSARQFMYCSSLFFGLILSSFMSLSIYWLPILPLRSPIK